MPARQPRYSKEEFARRGDEIYARDIRPQVDSEQNKGKFVLIDIETGAWEMDADEMAASRRIDARIPDAHVWMVRVGYPYVRRIATRHDAWVRRLQRVASPAGVSLAEEVISREALYE